VETERKTRRRRPSGIPSIVSIGLVLFSLGLLGLSIIFAREASRSLKEEFLIEVFFKDSTDALAAEVFTGALGKKPWTKSVLFVHQDAAAQKMTEEYGEDFLQYYGVNFFPHKTELHLEAAYTAPANVKAITGAIQANPMVDEVRYQPDMLDQITQNINLAQWVIGALSVILVLVAVSLISSALRLSIFASRFLIKSMQLVGATEFFIIRPFMYRFVGFAFWGWIISVVLLSLSISFFVYKLGIAAFDPDKLTGPFLALSGILLLSGVILAMLSAWFGARKYLRMQIDQLY